jgi:aspartyl protease family protein
MGLEDRDWWRNAQKERAMQRISEKFKAANGQAPRSLPTRLKWAPMWIIVFWMAIMALIYVAMDHYLKPQAVTVSASGDLLIPKARDGHFYATGTINGKSVRFLVDTGASTITVSEAFAREAGLSGGVPTVFSTANGSLTGRIVKGVTVQLGPLEVSGVKVAVGLVGLETDQALLGQSFLSKFDILVQKNQMTLRKRS